MVSRVTAYEVSFRARRLVAFLVAFLVIVGCEAQTPLVCVGIDASSCRKAIEVAVSSLSADVRDGVERATVRPTTVVSCTSAPACRPFADVELDVRGAASPVVVTVSTLPDGRLIAETY